LRRIRIAVVGAGAFGKNHLRVLEQSARAELVAVVDRDRARVQEAGRRFGCAALEDCRALKGQAEAAVVAVPTEAHAEVGCALLEAGLDVLVEKPMAADLASAQRLVHAAQEGSRIFQVGHLERFNPAVMALKEHTQRPLFFEIHRLSVFTPRSLDIDVVLDLMIHDLDIVLDLVGQLPQEIRAAGISILSSKVDIASVRLAFPSGCVANLTASRVSTERVRKLRMFQPGQYVSLDYSRQDAVVFRVGEDRQIVPSLLPVEKAEPLRLELEAFLDAVETRAQPLVTAAEACRALEVALAILAKIEEHSRLIASSLPAQGF
jgi:predicted dehydrogenase